MDKADIYARIPSSMEVVERPHRPVIKVTGEVIDVNDRNLCFICGCLVDEPVVCDRCGFIYCKEHNEPEYHKCRLPSHQEYPRKALRLLALDMRKLMAAEYMYQAKLDDKK